MCKENGIDPSTDKYAVTRVDYAIAIDTLLSRLEEHGVDVKGNGKEAGVVLMHGTDRCGRYYTKERILVKTEEEENEEVNRNC